MKIAKKPWEQQKNDHNIRQKCKKYYHRGEKKSEKSNRDNKYDTLPSISQKPQQFADRRVKRVNDELQGASQKFNTLVKKKYFNKLTSKQKTEYHAFKKCKMQQAQLKQGVKSTGDVSTRPCKRIIVLKSKQNTNKLLMSRTVQDLRKRYYYAPDNGPKTHEELRNRLFQVHKERTAKKEWTAKNVIKKRECKRRKYMKHLRQRNAERKYDGPKMGQMKNNLCSRRRILLKGIPENKKKYTPPTSDTQHGRNSINDSFQSMQ